MTEIENSAPVSRSIECKGESWKRPWCNHCTKPQHSKETRWKIYGKPLNWKKKPGSENQAFQASHEENPDNKSSFTMEQLEHLYKLFQSPQFVGNPCCSLAQKHNFIIAFICVNSSQTNSRIIDSGAINHMTSSSNLFSTYNSCARTKSR